MSSRTVVVLVAVAAAAVASATPPVSARLKALPVAAEAIGLNVPRPLAPTVTRRDTTVGAVPGDLYTTGRAAPPIVLLPGATTAGRDDTRAVAVAGALARAHRTVFVPELSLYQRRIDEDDLDRIAAAAAALAEHPLGRGRVSILGFSYGGAYGLVAAADPRLSGRVAQVATFGAYWDLLGVIGAATTGTSLVGGRRLAWDGDPAAAELLREHALPLVAAEDRPALAAALAGRADPARLPRAAHAVHALLTNDDPDRVAELAAALAPDARATLRRFSPATVAADIDAPIAALHSVDDPAVPYAEALRLAADRPDARLLTVELFTHVDFAATDLVRAAPDLWRTGRFAGWVLAAQERW